MNYSYRSGSGSSFLKILVTVVSLAAISLGAAFFWQRAEDSPVEPEPGGGFSPVFEDLGVSSSDASSASVSAADDEYRDIEMPDDVLADVKAPASSEIEVSALDSSADAQEETTGTPAGYVREAVVGSVPQSTPVGYDYFDDAIFFGDSISTGIPLYMQTVVPNTAVVAAQGVSPGGALTSQCINTNSGRVTMLEAARAKGARKKIYIMLGANALDYDEEPFIKGYTEFLQAVKAEYPEAVIYVQSMLPVTANVNKVYPSKNINNERISAYNKSICKMALEAGVNYIDVAQGMEDENGMLPNEASPLDGMHLSSEYYMKWFDYLRSHTVSPKK